MIKYYVIRYPDPARFLPPYPCDTTWVMTPGEYDNPNFDARRDVDRGSRENTRGRNTQEQPVAVLERWKNKDGQLAANVANENRLHIFVCSWALLFL